MCVSSRETLCSGADTGRLRLWVWEAVCAPSNWPGGLVRGAGMCFRAVRALYSHRVRTQAQRGSDNGGRNSSGPGCGKGGGALHGAALSSKMRGQFVCPPTDPSRWHLHRYLLSGLNTTSKEGPVFRQ